ncbi:DUF4340 domain-containing protein [Methylolobus aquaticus]
MTHINSRTVGLLGVAAVLAIVAAVALNHARRPVAEPDRSATFAVPALHGHINDVTGLTITGPENKVLVTLTKSSQGWRVKERGDYPADTGKLRELLLKLTDAALLEPKTANPQRYAELGVDEPAGTDAKGVLLTLDGLGQPVRLIVGTTASRGGATFVRRPDEPQSWLAKGELTVAKAPTDWLETAMVDLPAARIRQVSLRRPDGKTVRIEKAQESDTTFRLLDVPKGREVAEGAPARLASIPGGLMLADVMPQRDAEVPGNGQVTTAVFTTFDGLVLQLDAWKKDGRPLARLTTQVDAALADARIAADQAKAKAEHEAPQKAADAKTGNKPAGDALSQAVGAPASPPLAVSDPAADRRQRLDKLNAEAAELSARFAGWTFVLPDFKYAELDKTVDSLLKPSAAAAPSAGKKPAARK